MQLGYFSIQLDVLHSALLLTVRWPTACWEEVSGDQHWSGVCWSSGKHTTWAMRRLTLMTWVTGWIVGLFEVKIKKIQFTRLKNPYHKKNMKKETFKTYLKVRNLPWLESWAAWERIEVRLKADGPAVRSLWSIDCNEACVTAAVRTRKQTVNL